jgi:polar amino acid transport system ATP-binding protein
MASPIISFRGVEKSFGASAVLRNFNLDVARHEHLVLIGPSGSGKSTVLRILMTLEDIQRGDLIVDGEFLWRDTGSGSRKPPSREINAIRQKIGMVFQSFNLFPHMTVMRNVAEAPIRVLNMPKEAAYERARELLRQVGLSDKETQYPIQLSGGQQQRVAIARCLAMRPQILLFDEVTSALDPEKVSEVLNVVRNLAREESFTIIIVTHQMHVAKEIGHRVCFLEEGRIVEEGEPRQMLDRPQNERTRSFLRAILEA